MKVEDFIREISVDFYTGVPDSQLKPLCDYLINMYGISEKHIIAANEGNSMALAAGYYLATGKFPLVYLQNSGIGNIINPIASLLSEKVYGIPCILVVGWRGTPGTHDEPQHVFQGEITVKLLEDMGINSFVLEKETGIGELRQVIKRFSFILSEGKQVAIIVKKNALEYHKKTTYINSNIMCREEIIDHILDMAEEDVIVSTTGKASRELFELRQGRGQSHKYDFLTVGSMGHSSSIALGIALQQKNKKIWCIDGDGSVLMHMGAMAVMGKLNPSNIIHVVINNGAHETVGGMPTVLSDADLVQVAKGCGYIKAESVTTPHELDKALKEAKEFKYLSFIEAKCAIGSRSNLGRPSDTPQENMREFMCFLGSQSDL